MKTSICPPNLPLELVLQIIDTLTPAHPIPIALPPSHPTTTTLISFTSTSRAIRPIAVRLLYRYCLYIDCERPLWRLLVALGLGKDDDDGEDVLGSLSVKRLLQPLAFRPRRLFITTEEEEDEHLWIKPIIDDMGTLLSYLAPTLTHLVINLPLRTLGTRSQKLLRKSLENLPNLELVCDLQGSYNISTGTLPPLPKLRHLALYSPDVCTDDFLSALERMPDLESLVIVRTYGLQEEDFERRWGRMMKARNDETDVSISKLLVIVVNVESDHRSGIPRAKIGKWMEIRRVNVPTSYYGDEDAGELSQKWVRRRILSGAEPGGWEL
ncbi:hypothetical protein BJ875DRAFT_410922 [Amylocarpus encephaloides]|uniref:F-box domain-containing protein n=1 Tax=Amylocarpus encephaloides TaxID=45428 RepID=A0A9P8C0H7_9HELO|nr:hypothetical protein BJ875DRAFT_410922 [Amylocarpus encephaloides]